MWWFTATRRMSLLSYGKRQLQSVSRHTRCVMFTETDRSCLQKCVVSIRRCLLAKVPNTLNPYWVSVKINHVLLVPGILRATRPIQRNGRRSFRSARTAVWKQGGTPSCWKKLPQFLHQTRYIQGAHKFFPLLQTFITRKTRGIKTFF